MASALEQFVSSVRGLYVKGNRRGVVDLIKKSGREVLSKNLPHLDNVLETLDMAEHTLGVLAVLLAKMAAPGSGTQEHQEALLTQVTDFITNCDQWQINIAPDLFAELCHLVTGSLVAQNTPLRGVPLLLRAISKLQPSESHLTSVHADLCQLCLLAKCFNPVLPILSTDMTAIALEDGQFDAKYLLLYYYYGGMIFIALKRYEEALYMLEVAVSTPARAVSHIMLEAYKKYILVSVILQGKMPVMPKYISQVMTRFIKPMSVAYQELASACQANNAEQARAILAKHEALFLRDKNLGLARQVLASLYKNNIQRLTKTFLTLSLQDVAARVQLGTVDEAERYILNMIEDGEIFATVNRKDGMVVFHDDPEKYNSPEMLKQLEDEVTSCMELDRKMQSMEEEICLTPLFVQKCSSQEDEPTAKLCPYSM